MFVPALTLEATCLFFQLLAFFQTLVWPGNSREESWPSVNTGRKINNYIGSNDNNNDSNHNDSNHNDSNNNNSNNNDNVKDDNQNNYIQVFSFLQQNFWDAEISVKN